MSKKDKKILNRLKRAEGQAKAIRKMYEEDKDCLDIIQQVNATKAALNKVSAILLKEKIQSCYGDKDDENLESVLKTLINLN